MSREVLVVGGGWAGCAAALACAARGFRVTLHEAAPALGGRARTVMRHGLPLDNGQHLLLGAYASTRALLDRLHDGAAPAARERLEIAPLDAGHPQALHLRARALPAPLGLALGFAQARGLTLGERRAAIAGFLRWKRARFRCDAAATVDDLLAGMPRAVGERLWAPLCVAALNTPPARASGQVFLNVAQAVFDARSDAASLLTPATHLGALVPQAAAGALAAHGHEVVTGSRAAIAGYDGPRLLAQLGARQRAFDAAIVATGPHQLAAALPPALHEHGVVAPALAAVSRYAYEPITTAYLGYRGARVALPRGLVRLGDDPGHWLFDRGDILRNSEPGAPALDQLVSVVISASGPHDAWTHAALADAVHRQLARAQPGLPAPVFMQVIAERRATYACVPGMRHPPVRVAPRLYLAGDHVYPRFPATLEAAVRSGEAAAQALAEDFAPMT